MRLLVVEDDDDIRTLISFHMKSIGAEVAEARDGYEALSLLKEGNLDLALLDIMLPGLSGIEILKTIREEGPDKTLPVIVASALDAESDIITALEEGADDYITKPFSTKILAARVKSLLRRSSGRSEEERLSTAEGISLDRRKRKCFLHDREISLTQTEFDILFALIGADGRVMRRTEIIEEIKGNDYHITERSVDVQIASIRKKLGEAGKTISTVWGIGYRYAEE